jgi:hypothetical protein
MPTVTQTATTTSGGTTTTCTTTTTTDTDEEGVPPTTCPPCADDPGAIVACKCGKTKLKFTVSMPRNRLECCCVDCNDAFKWAQSKGGPAPSGRGRASDSWYFENDITILSGDENVQFNNLNEGYPTKRMVATCCHSVLCGDHPAYQGHVCIVFGDFLQSAQYMPQLLRFCSEDVAEDEQCFLQDKEFPHGIVPNASEECLGPILAVLGPRFEPPPTTTVGKTIQQLIKEKGCTHLGWIPTNGKVSPLAAKPE